MQQFQTNEDGSFLLVDGRRVLTVLTPDEKVTMQARAKHLLSKLKYQLPTFSEDEARRLHQERISKK